MGKSSPTCGRSAWGPNQLRSGVDTTICGAGCGEVNTNHKALTGRLKEQAGLRPEGQDRGLRPESQGGGLRPGTQDDGRKTESTGHGNPVNGSSIAFAKAATSARNSFSSLRMLDTEGAVDAGGWGPRAGNCVSNAFLAGHIPLTLGGGPAIAVEVVAPETATGKSKGESGPKVAEMPLVCALQINMWQRCPRSGAQHRRGKQETKQTGKTKTK